jgi:2-phospho-L-lactate/phosphoenolpyruvate guanylyltransferase
MRTLAVLPMKGFPRAKQRLAAEVAAAPRRALAEAMFADVLIALRRCPAVDDVLVVTGDLTAQRLAGGHGARIADDRDEAGQSAAASAGIREALDRGYERAVLVPGDVPVLDPEELEALLGRPRAGTPDALIVPDRHGTGTNALVLTPPDALRPGFGPDSLTRHVDRAREDGVAHEVVEVPSLALDVDTPDDLAALRERFEGTRGGAAHTRGFLHRLARAAATV